MNIEYKNYFTKEEVEQARKFDLFSYLKIHDPNELIMVNPYTYCTKTHDSLKISNGKRYWWSQGLGGVSALD